MLGRRGPAQAAFTPPELKELGELGGADVIVDPADLALDPASEAALEADRARARRNVDILHEFAASKPAGKPRRLVLRFCVSPGAILGDGKVEAIEVVHNELVPDGRGSVRAVATEEHEVIPCGIVFRSVGYKGVELPGVPFDAERATIRNDCGRALDEQGASVPGVYCAGWIKRGPSGVIGTNKKDATETVELLLEDARSGRLPKAPGASAEAVDALLAERGVEVVMYPGWELIDRIESERGAPYGRPRVKLASWDELLRAARG
jgi:ferredoxin--NADP+ reductase